MTCIIERSAPDRSRPVAQLACLILVLTFVCQVGFAHPELQLQIDELTAQLELDPDNVDLLLKRGDLQRRHEHPDLALADFKRVREIQADNQVVNWFEGRLEVQTGDPNEGVRLLDRFLLDKPGHVLALQNRAEGYLKLNQPLLAARDYQAVIVESDNPTPAIYSSCALAFIAAGPDSFSDAMDITRQGLALFPSEVTLTGIATDLSLAQSDVDSANSFINAIPAPIRTLPQWQTRIALADCQSGHEDRTRQWFLNALGTSQKSPNATGQLSETWLNRLAAQPGAQNCQAAALDKLNNHEQRLR